MSFYKSVLKDKKLLENVSFIAILQVFNIIAPLITYPYLVRVLGMDNYGIIITAQILVGYFSILILFGSDNVCAKHVSINRNQKDSVSRIYSAVLLSRAFLWLCGLGIYILIVSLVPLYRNHFLLFLITYGLTFQDILFPQYLFQGLEKMKFTTCVNIFTKVFFITLVFVFVKSSSDLLIVPILYTLGYLISGVFSFLIVTKHLNIKLVPYDYSTIKLVLKDSLPIFASELILTIKDRFNILIMGHYIGMANVVVFDFALKIVNLLGKPAEVIRIALFPRAAKDRNMPQIKKVFFLILVLTFFLVIITNIFLPYLVDLFLTDTVDLLPIRLFSIAPIFIASGAYISSNIFIALGYNKYVLISIVVTTICYLLSLLYVIITKRTTSVMSFMMVSLISYIVEFIYRVLKFQKVCRSN